MNTMHLSSRNNLLLVLFVLVGLNASGAGPVFNVLDYGAHRDGSTNSTEAFRSAIQAAKAAGGGTVFVPAGNYITGPIELVSNLVLHIDAGATLRFPATRLPFTEGPAAGHRMPYAGAADRRARFGERHHHRPRRADHRQC